MQQYQLSKHLHKPALLVALELPELTPFIVGYIMGMLGGGFWWLALFILPAVTIPWSRKKPRGHIQHMFCMLGVTKLEGYPILLSREFEE